MRLKEMETLAHPAYNFPEIASPFVQRPVSHSAFSIDPALASNSRE